MCGPLCNRCHRRQVSSCGTRGAYICSDKRQLWSQFGFTLKAADASLPWTKISSLPFEAAGRAHFIRCFKRYFLETFHSSQNFNLKNFIYIMHDWGKRTRRGRRRRKKKHHIWQRSRLATGSARSPIFHDTHRAAYARWHSKRVCARL